MYMGIEHRKTEQQAEAAWSQLQRWRVAAEDDQRMKQKWSKDGPNWRGRKGNVCAHQQVSLLQ